jgi:actin-related protein
MDHPVLNLEPIAHSRANLEKATQIMFETFNVPAYCYVAQVGVSPCCRYHQSLAIQLCRGLWCSSV